MRRSLVYLAAALMMHGAAVNASLPPCECAQDGLRDMRLALESFAASNGGYPDSLDELQQLSTKSIIAANPVDAWGQRFSYRRRGEGYELYSNGPDRVPGTYDDIFADIPWIECGERTGCSCPFVDIYY